MSGFKIALQLYSIRHDCEKDLEKSLKAVAEMGYEGVELAGNYGKSAKEWKELLDKFNLKVAGAHVPINLLQGEEFKNTVEFYRTLETKYIVIPALPKEMTQSKDDWLKIADTFNEISEKLKNEGMRLGYHNHMIEFQPVDGKWPWYWLFDNLNPDIIMQLDTGNAMHAGVTNDDLIEIIKKYPGRATTVHLKEYSATNDKALVGEGDVDFKKFIKTCEEFGKTDWYIIEQESYAYEPLECVRISIENLKKILKEI